MKTLGFLGMGNMAQAISGGLIRKGVLAPENIYAYTPHPDKLAVTAKAQGFRTCATPEELVERCDAVLVAVKPYQVEAVLAPLKKLLAGKVLLSVAASWNFARYEAILDPSTHHLFIMPNTPALVGDGVLILEETHSLTPQEFDQVSHWMAALGEVITLPSALMDIGGTVSSCSPAYFSLIIEAMADAGVMYGLSRPVAYRLASQAMAGTGKMLLQTGMHPGQLKDMVCSPNGTTIAGVAAMEKEGARNAMIEAVKASMERY